MNVNQDTTIPLITPSTPFVRKIARGSLWLKHVTVSKQNLPFLCVCVCLLESCVSFFSEHIFGFIFHNGNDGFLMGN